LLSALPARRSIGCTITLVPTLIRVEIGTHHRNFSIAQQEPRFAGVAIPA
jgi:hypothetical protein